MQIGNATILHIDCIEYLATLKDKAFDLCIVDPPYGIGESGKTNKTRGKLAIAKDYKPFAGGDLSAPNKEYFIELQRVSANQIIWGANHFAAMLPCPSSPSWIVWDKVNDGTDFADCELAYTSFKSHARIFRYMWNGMHQGQLGGDKRKNEHRIHPTQKPVKLYDWLITNYAKPGQRILDTHLGSGSSAIACNNLGFEMVGCELDYDYYTAACKRIENHNKQLRLFA